jgi:hypothetical protein
MMIFHSHGTDGQSGSNEPEPPLPHIRVTRTGTRTATGPPPRTGPFDDSEPADYSEPADSAASAVWTKTRTPWPMARSSTSKLD